MERVAYTGITEVTTFLLLHRKGVDNLTNTKLHAKFLQLVADHPCTRIELSLEVNPTVLGPLSEFLTRICNLQGMHQLARDYHASFTTLLQVELVAYINGVTSEHITGAPSCDGGGSHVGRPASISSPSSPTINYTGICIGLQVTFMVSYHGNSHHKMVEYQCKDHMTINIHGHTLITTLHPHYYYEPGLSSRRNKLHAVRGKRQMISGIRTRSGGTVALQLSVASAAVPGLPSLARGKKLPADRLCRTINVIVYGPGGVPVFPPLSKSGLLLSQVVNWEDYGVAIGNQCSAECTDDNFDQIVIPSFSNELIISKDSTQASVVERNCVLYVFLFIEAVVESVDVSSTDSIGYQFRSLQILQNNLEDIQLSHLKQFHTAFHTSLNKLLCNYNSFSKINSSLEEAIPSLSEAVASIISHSREESFRHSCHDIMGVEPTGEEEVQQWTTERLWRIASHKLGAQYHNGQLIRAAEEPDTPDITAAVPPHRSSLAVHDSDNTLVTDIEEELVVPSSRRSYHPFVPSSHHSHTDSGSSEPDCVIAESFTTLGGEDLEWSDTDHITSDDITDDELWSDDDTVVDNSTLWDDNNITTCSTDSLPIATNSSLVDTLTCVSTNDNPSLHSEMLIPSDDDDITTNKMSENTKSSNVSPDGSLVAKNSSSVEVITIKVPSVLAHSEVTTQDEPMSVIIQTMDNSTQSMLLLSRESSPERGDTCFDELADLPSSPDSEAMTENNITCCINPTPDMPTDDMLDSTGYHDNMEDHCLMDYLSTLSSTDVDDCDLDWN